MITRATEILDSGGIVRLRPDTKRLLRISAEMRRTDFPKLHSYICQGEHDRRDVVRIKERHLCTQRDPWYCVEWPEPAPILATYMARRPPAFALNPEKLGVLNIGHYLHPHRSDLDVAAVVYELNRQRERLVGSGRTYQGGLEKFEPSEMLNLEVDMPERILEPVDVNPKGPRSTVGVLTK